MSSKTRVRRWRVIDDLVAALRRILSLPAAPTVEEQRAEAARVVESAARREAADEVIRATSRRVMQEMWPARTTAAPAANAKAADATAAAGGQTANTTPAAGATARTAD